MKLIKTSKNGLKKAVNWYMNQYTEVFEMTKGNKFWM